MRGVDISAVPDYGESKLMDHETNVLALDCDYVGDKRASKFAKSGLSPLAFTFMVDTGLLMKGTRGDTRGEGDTLLIDGHLTVSF